MDSKDSTLLDPYSRVSATCPGCQHLSSLLHTLHSQNTSLRQSLSTLQQQPCPIADTRLDMIIKEYQEQRVQYQRRCREQIKGLARVLGYLSGCWGELQGWQVQGVVGAGVGGLLGVLRGMPGGGDVDVEGVVRELARRYGGGEERGNKAKSKESLAQKISDTLPHTNRYSPSLIDSTFDQKHSKLLRHKLSKMQHLLRTLLSICKDDLHQLRLQATANTTQTMHAMKQIIDEAVSKFNINGKQGKQVKEGKEGNQGSQHAKNNSGKENLRDKVNAKRLNASRKRLSIDGRESGEGRPPLPVPLASKNNNTNLKISVYNSYSCTPKNSTACHPTPKSKSRQPSTKK